jgi:PTH2 family peptidyl-tRNA hydrolase
MKQIICMRKDLKMRRGKEIAQGAHASLGATLSFIEHEYVVEWLKGSFTKITLQINSEEEIHQLCELARKEKIPYAKIQDAGRTEFNGIPTFTCCAIGPAPANVVDKITGHLKLY